MEMVITGNETLMCRVQNEHNSWECLAGDRIWDGKGGHSSSREKKPPARGEVSRVIESEEMGFEATSVVSTPKQAAVFLERSISSLLFPYSFLIISVGLNGNSKVRKQPGRRSQTRR